MSSMTGVLSGCVLILGAAIIFLIAAYKRCFSTPEFGKWQGGGKLTFTGLTAICLFLGSIGAMIAYPNGIWVFPALLAFLVGFISQIRSERRERAEEDALRKINGARYPGIFENPPPTDLNALPGTQVDLYDAGACTFIGTVDKSDIQAIIEELPDLEPNDIYVLQEFLEMSTFSKTSQNFKTLVNAGFEHRDYLLLRWMPVANPPRHTAIP